MTPYENPFLNILFTSIWKKHFNPSGADYTFKSLPNLEFVKAKGLPIYINVGKRMTQGINYEIKNHEFLKELARKVILVYDVPEYLESHDHTHFDFKLLKSVQYAGYLANLETFANAEAYTSSNVRPKSRRLIVRSKRRLNLSFDIKYRVLFGPDVTDHQYSFYMDRFKALLDHRYESKDEQHPFISPKNWEYHMEMVLPLIRAKKAALFIIEDAGTPIAINLNYIGNRVLFSALPAFDLDFQKFNIGHIMTLWTLEWCKQNGVKIFDFSKGHYDYKRRWSNEKYSVNYHILYDSKSLRARFFGFGLYLIFEGKRRLRKSLLFEFVKKGFDTLKAGNSRSKPVRYLLEMDVKLPEDKDLSDFNMEDLPHLKALVHEFLFRSQEKRVDVKLLRIKNVETPIYIKGIRRTGSIHKAP